MTLTLPSASSSLTLTLTLTLPCASWSLTPTCGVRSFCQENDRNLAAGQNPVSDCADDVVIRRDGVPAGLGGEEFLYMRSRDCLLEADEVAHAL